MNWRYTLGLSLLVVLFSLAVASAQESCAAFVQSALNTLLSGCVATGSEQACYGHGDVTAFPKSENISLTFNQSGDMVFLEDVQAIRTSAMDINSTRWGISLMQIRANLPETMPQNVTMLLLGDVTVEQAPTGSAFSISVVTNQPVNVREVPGNSGTIVGSLDAGTVLNVTGKGVIRGEEWLRIDFNHVLGEVAWVVGNGVSGGERDALPIYKYDGTLLQAPQMNIDEMQAFTLRNGMNDPACAEAPESGILIQTPLAIERVSLLINEVEVRIIGTIFVQTRGDVLTVFTLDGTVGVSAFGSAWRVPPGASVDTPLNSQHIARDVPEQPTPYRFASVQALPVSILPQVISIPEAISSFELARVLPPTPTPLPPDVVPTPQIVDAPIVSVAGVGIPDSGIGLGQQYRTNRALCINDIPPPAWDGVDCPLEWDAGTSFNVLDGPRLENNRLFYLIQDVVSSRQAWWRRDNDSNIQCLNCTTVQRQFVVYQPSYIVPIPNCTPLFSGPSFIAGDTAVRSLWLDMGHALEQPLIIMNPV